MNFKTSCTICIKRDDILLLSHKQCNLWIVQVTHASCQRFYSEVTHFKAPSFSNWERVNDFKLSYGSVIHIFLVKYKFFTVKILQIKCKCSAWLKDWDSQNFNSNYCSVNWVCKGIDFSEDQYFLKHENSLFWRIH